MFFFPMFCVLFPLQCVKIEEKTKHPNVNKCK